MQKTIVDLKTMEFQTVPLSESEMEEVQQRVADAASTLPVREIERIERDNPITHRALREGQIETIEILRVLRAKINELDVEVAKIASRTAQPLPEIPVSHLERVMKAVDDAIRAERAKL